MNYDNFRSLYPEGKNTFIPFVIHKIGIIINRFKCMFIGHTFYTQGINGEGTCLRCGTTRRNKTKKYI